MNTRNKLEKFVLEHRDAFDDERPSFKVWADIEKQIKRKKTKNREIWIWSVAASFLLIIGIALGIMVYPRIYEHQQLHALSQSEEFIGMHAYFDGEIKTLFAQLQDDQQAKNLHDALNEVDQQINRLKIDLIHAPKKSKQIILQAIIESYEAKVSLLETAVIRKKEVKKINNEIEHI